ncbi:hypothetical protein VN0448_12700 [Helicobacter pylori]|nr:hypothetical protein VN0448_12700 [Helicobacter pylori]
MKKIRFKNPTQLAKNLKQKTKIRSKSSNTRIKKQDLSQTKISQDQLSTRSKINAKNQTNQMEVKIKQKSNKTKERLNPIFQN